ncbi:YheT family hydrolase [Tenacibaculum sp. SG-28]|uniref:YheT family hydrolase n=1 Tax=Tenacibaculum sp. SG-28 TaxID=754426 RepID=UPI000CF48B05|nr:alpha/beta fold hydrolase [Tenacibaculum sp. SG-28]PQJ23380.1 alpha/beta hydrolase [Tenacibaculum sp. SG-28]
MPLLSHNFNPSLPFKNPHFNTIYRPLFMTGCISYQRKRIPTWDNDFLDLDFSIVKSKTIVLLIHGLEGSAQSNYMITSASQLNKAGYDTVCLNLRGCSEEDNLLLGTYHSGKTDDIKYVVEYLVSNYNYDNIVLLGFSLGGNLALKYIGEYKHIPKELKVTVAVSVPIDLTASQRELSKFKNKIYLREFLKSMKIKLLKKAEKFPEFTIDKNLLAKASLFRHIEEQYTVPVFGFDSPEDYWKKASSKPYIPKIKTPTLLINALDDSFLSPECYPFDVAMQHDNFYLLAPNYGGHVGFLSSFYSSQNYWLEKEIIAFIEKKLVVK